jgi:hypothetical protein
MSLYRHSNLPYSNYNKSKNRTPMAKREEVDLEITELVDCKAERVESG